MKTFKVIVPNYVLAQVESQVVYIARDSVDNALVWEDRLLRALRALAHAHGHAIDHDASDRVGKELRKLVFEGTYLVHYLIDEAAGLVEVVNFRHGARLPRPGEP